MDMHIIPKTMYAVNSFYAEIEVSDEKLSMACIENGENLNVAQHFAYEDNTTLKNYRWKKSSSKDYFLFDLTKLI